MDDSRPRQLYHFDKERHQAPEKVLAPEKCWHLGGKGFGTRLWYYAERSMCLFNISTTAECPLFCARRSGVQLSLSFAPTSAPFSSSSFTILIFPLSAAQCSGVQSFQSFASTSAPFSSSCRAISSCPFPAAMCSAVRPS